MKFGVTAVMLGVAGRRPGWNAIKFGNAGAKGDVGAMEPTKACGEPLLKSALNQRFVGGAS